MNNNLFIGIIAVLAIALICAIIVIVMRRSHISEEDAKTQTDLAIKNTCKTDAGFDAEWKKKYPGTDAREAFRKRAMIFISEKLVSAATLADASQPTVKQLIANDIYLKMKARHTSLPTGETEGTHVYMSTIKVAGEDAEASITETFKNDAEIKEYIKAVFACTAEDIAAVEVAGRAAFKTAVDAEEAAYTSGGAAKYDTYQGQYVNTVASLVAQSSTASKYLVKKGDMLLHASAKLMYDAVFTPAFADELKYIGFSPIEQSMTGDMLFVELRKLYGDASQKDVHAIEHNGHTAGLLAIAPSAH